MLPAVSVTAMVHQYPPLNDHKGSGNREEAHETMKSLGIEREEGVGAVTFTVILTMISLRQDYLDPKA